MNREDALALLANVEQATDEQIAEALAVLGADAGELAADPTPENLGQLRQLVEAGEALDAVARQREEDRTARQLEADELLARIPGLSQPADQVVETGEVDVDLAPAAEAAPADDAGDVVVPDDASSIPEAAPVPVGAAAQGTVVAAAAATPQGGARTLPRAARSIAEAQRRAQRPTTRPAGSDAAPLVASAALSGFREGERIAPDAWARFADGVIASSQLLAPSPDRTWSDDRILAAERLRYGGGQKISLARIPVNFGGAPKIGTGSGAEAEGTLDKLRGETVAAVRAALNAGGGLTAAGGCPCAPYPVDYSIFNQVESWPSMEADIPAIQMARGGIRYMECLDWSGYSAGTEVRDCADENTAIESYAAKPCVRITCPSELSTAPIIIPACLTVGNFIQATYPELVRQALEWLTIHYEDLKQQAFEDAIRANAIAGTNYTSATQYGAARDYLGALSRATAMYRARRHMRPDSPLIVSVPYFAPEILVHDVRNQGYGGLEQYGEISNADAWFRDQLRKFNVVPSYWYLRPTSVSSTQWINKAQTDAAALNAWPTVIETVITAPGVWNRGQIADIDFGQVVDSPLIRTNDAMFFMETMVSIFSRCSTATELLASTICPNGTAAQLTTAFTC